MSRSCLLLVVSALAMLAVCVQATDNEMTVFSFNSNPECLGPVDSWVSWAPVSSTSTPNCTAYHTSVESPQYYVASDTATCSLLGEPFHIGLYRTETCNEDQPYSSRSFTSGCSELLLKREEKAQRSTTWGPSQAFSCMGDPMIRPYVSLRVSGPCPVGPAQPAKRASGGDYTAIFSNAAANECFQYYNATQEANQYVKLTNGICNPTVGTVSFALYSDETCTTLVDTYDNVPLASCTPVAENTASVTITCLAPASTPAPSSVTPGMVPPPPRAPTGAATQLAVASLAIFASFVALLL